MREDSVRPLHASHARPGKSMG